MTTLPTTPGKYRDRTGDDWRLEEDGTWTMCPEYATYLPDDEHDLRTLNYYAPYTPETGDPEKREAVERVIYAQDLPHRDPAELVDEIMAVFA